MAGNSAALHSECRAPVLHQYYPAKGFLDLFIIADGVLRGGCPYTDRAQLFAAGATK